MDLRVTPQVLVSRALTQLQRRSGAVASLQQQAVSGQRLERPSDDPGRASALARLQAHDQRLVGQLGAIDAASSRMNGAVAALTEAGQILTSARQVAIEGGQSTNTDASMEALAVQVDEMLTRLTNVANTQQDGEYLFAGTATRTQPFVTAPDGTVTYAGSGDAALTPIGDGNSVPALLPGSEAFQGPAGTQDAFQVLATLRDALRNTAGLNQTDQFQAVSAKLDDLDRIQAHVLDVTGAQSSRLEELAATRQHVEDVQLEVQKRATETGDADLASVAIRLQEEQNGYQFALAASAQLLNVSILDFLR